MPDSSIRIPFLINFLNGTLDLRTGELKPHDEKQYLTKLVPPQLRNRRPNAHSFWASSAASGWPRRRLRARPGPRRAAWWSTCSARWAIPMTGTTEEKAVFVPFGTGNNGKTTLLSTFLQLLEEYAVLLQVDTLMVRAESNNSRPTWPTCAARGSS